MTLKLITAPATEPITLAEVKVRLRLDADVTSEDDMISAMIVGARQRAEHLTGRALITQTWERVVDLFPGYGIELGMPPVTAITSLTYIDSALDSTVMDSSLYSLDADFEPGFVVPAYGTDWPNTADTPNAVRVRFTCGYGAASDVPQAIRDWIHLQVGAMYRNREAFAVGVSVAELPNRFVDGLLDPYCIRSA